MGFALTLIYLVLTLITPKELVPDLMQYRIVLIVFLLALLFSSISALGNGFTFKAPQLVLLIAMVLYSALTVLYAVRWFGGAVDAVFDLLFLAGIVLAVSWNISSVGRLRVLIWLLSIIGIVITVQGIIALTTGYRIDEFAILDGSDPDKITGIRTYVYRIQGLGFLGDPNDFAQFLLADTALLGCCWKPKSFGKNIIRVILPGAMLLTGVVLTRSRGAMLAFLVMVFFLLQKKLGKAAYIVGGALGAGLIVAMTVLTGREMSMSEGSAAGRLDAWYAGMQMFKSSPIFGVGFQRFTEHNSLTAHNSYMLCIAELGAPGFLLWLGLIVASMVQMRGVGAITLDTPAAVEVRQLARSLWVAFFMFAVTAWFLSRSYSTVLFILIGCSVGVSELGEKAGMPVYAGGKSWRLLTVGFGVVIFITLYGFLRARGLG
jgi:O-antigen ligase